MRSLLLLRQVDHRLQPITATFSIRHAFGEDLNDHDPLRDHGLGSDLSSTLNLGQHAPTQGPYAIDLAEI